MQIILVWVEWYLLYVIARQIFDLGSLQAGRRPGEASQPERRGNPRSSLGFVYLQVMDRRAVARDDNINGLSKCHSCLGVNKDYLYFLKNRFGLDALT